MEKNNIGVLNMSTLKGLIIAYIVIMMIQVTQNGKKEKISLRLTKIRIRLLLQERLQVVTPPILLWIVPFNLQTNSKQLSVYKEKCLQKKLKTF